MSEKGAGSLDSPLTGARKAPRSSLDPEQRRPGAALDVFAAEGPSLDGPLVKKRAGPGSGSYAHLAQDDLGLWMNGGRNS